MEVLERAFTPNKTAIQIENWANDYPNTFKKNATIGFYPIAKNSIYKENRPLSPYPKIGEKFRASLDFNTEAEAKEAFENLKNGNKSFLDYMKNYSSYVISKEDFIKAVTE